MSVSNGNSLAFWFVNYITNVFTNTAPGYVYANTNPITSFTYSYDSSNDYIIVAYVEKVSSDYNLKYTFFKFNSQSSLTLLNSGTLITQTSSFTVSYVKFIQNFLLISANSFIESFLINTSDSTSTEWVKSSANNVVYDIMVDYPDSDNSRIELYTYLNWGSSRASRISASNSCFFYKSHEGGSYVCRTKCLASQFTYQNKCITCTAPNIYLVNGVCTSSCTAPNSYYTPSGVCATSCSGSSPFYNSGNICTASCSSPTPYNNTNVCVSSCSSPNDLLDSSTNSCVASCPATSPYSNSSNICVASCSTPDLYLDGTKCKNSCSGTNNYIDTLNNTCVSSCPSWNPIVENTNKCVSSCSDPTYVIDNNQCVSSCPPARPYLNPANNTCTSTCTSPNPYISANSTVCVPSCVPPNSLIDNGKCSSTCSASSPYINYDTKVCMPACTGSYSLLYDPSYCVQSCPVANKYNETNHCVATCSNNNPYYDSTFNCYLYCPSSASYVKTSKQCDSACDSGQYWYADGVNKVCTSQCPSNNPVHNLQNNQCVQSCAINTYSYNMKCYSTCPPPTIPFSNICANSCQEIGMYNYNGACVSRCPPTFTYDSSNNCTKASCANGEVLSNNQCITCKSIGMYFMAGGCLSICPQAYIPDSNNICLTCQASNKYLYDNDCYDTCPGGLVQNANNYTCTSCKDTQQLYFNNTCVSSCPDGYSSDFINWKCNPDVNAGVSRNSSTQVIDVLSTPPDYRLSTEELNKLADYVKNNPDVLTPIYMEKLIDLISIRMDFKIR